jgi:HEAT repeat protein
MNIGFHKPWRTTALMLALSCGSALAMAGEVDSAKTASLIKQLRAAEASKRIEAIAALCGARPVDKEAIPEIARLLKDKDLKVRRIAASELQRVGAGAAGVKAAVIEATADKDEMIAGVSMHLLRKFRLPAKEVLPVYVRALKRDSGMLSSAAAMGIKSLGKAGKDAVPHLLKALSSNHYHVRMAAGAALHSVSSDSVVLLEKEYAKASSSTKMTIVSILASQKAHQSRVFELALADKDYMVRDVAILEIEGKLGTQAIPLLLRTAQAKGNPCRVRAVKVLWRLGRPALPTLKQLVNSEDPEVRRRATKAVKKLDPSSTARPAEPSKVSSPKLAALIADLKKPGAYSRRQRAAKALGELGSVAKEATPALIRALDDESSYVAAEAVVALGKIGPDAGAAVPHLLEAAQDSVLRASAVKKSLRSIVKGSDKHLPALRKGMKHKDVRVRGAAAHALGCCGASARQDLEAAILKDKEASVRDEALVTICEAGPTSAVYPTIAAKLRKAGDLRQQVRMVQGLAAFAKTDNKAREALRVALESRYSQVRNLAAEALATVQSGSSQDAAALVATFVRRGSNTALRKAIVACGVSAVAPLDKALNQERTVGALAVRLLAQIGPKSVPALGRATNHPDREVRRAAVGALIKMGKDGSAALEKAAASGKGFSRHTVQGLAKHGGTVVPALRQLLKSPHADMAARSLGRIGAEAEPALPDLWRKWTAPGSDSRAKEYCAKAYKLIILELPPDKAAPVIRRALLTRQPSSTVLSLVPSLGSKHASGLARLVMPHLRSRYSKSQEMAALALAAAGPAARAALPDLTRLLRSPQSGVVRAAAMALGEIGPAAAPTVPALTKLASSPFNSREKLAAIWALGQIGPGARAAVVALKKGIPSKDPRVRCYSAKSLWQVTGDKRASVPVFRKALQGTWPSLLPAAESLAALGPAAKELEADVAKVLINRDGKVIVCLARALWKVSGKKDKLGDALEIVINDPSFPVRVKAAEFLDELGPEVIKKLADSLKRIAQDEEEFDPFRRRAARLLKRAGIDVKK